MPASWTALVPMWTTPQALSYSKSPVACAWSTGSIALTVPSRSTDTTRGLCRSPGIALAGTSAATPSISV